MERMTFECRKIEELSTVWKLYFLRIAATVEMNTKCHSRKCGAVIVKEKSIISTGYNGPPSGILPCDKRSGAQDGKCPRHKMGRYASGKYLEHCTAGHAESNTILQAARWGISIDGCTLVYAGPHPCKWCTIAIINAGIKRIVCLMGNYDKMGPQLASEAGIIVERVDIEKERLLK